MTLKQKFKEILTAFWINDWEDKCELIADEFAIGFVRWYCLEALQNERYKILDIYELLEIYKKEKGL